MRIVTVLGEGVEALRATGLTHGLLGRSYVRFEEIPPEEPIVDRLLIGGPPDLLVIDGDHPAFSPIEVIQGLRQLGSFAQVPIFLVSELDRVQEARAAGATECFKKPLDPALLEAALLKHVKPAVRKAHRKKLDSPCVLTKGGLKYEGRISDVSISGARVALPDKMPVGAMVQLAFAIIFQRTPRVIRLQARIVREVQGGYGLAFSALDQQARSLIAAYARV